MTARSNERAQNYKGEAHCALKLKAEKRPKIIVSKKSSTVSRKHPIVSTKAVHLTN